jgi:hypothetical protein
MKLLRALEEQRIEEMFNGTRCKQCSVPLGDNPDQMKRHPELPEMCHHCGDETLDLPKYDDETF